MGRGRQNPHNKNKTTEDAEIRDPLEVRKIHREHTGNTQGTQREHKGNDYEHTGTIMNTKGTHRDSGIPWIDAAPLEES
jgi:hypothetical protein